MLCCIFESAWQNANVDIAVSYSVNLGYTFSLVGRYLVNSTVALCVIYSVFRSPPPPGGKDSNDCMWVEGLGFRVCHAAHNITCGIQSKVLFGDPDTRQLLVVFSIAEADHVLIYPIRDLDRICALSELRKRMQPLTS